jgi:hypothetical protein
MRKSFMFYLTWKSQLDVLSDKELRRFVNNLILWHSGEEIELKTKSDLLVWNGILPALEVNEVKWNSRAESSKENGKQGGRPPKSHKTQQVIDEPKKPVNSKELNVDSKLETVDGGQSNADRKLGNVIDIGNTGMSQGSYFRNKIEKLTNEILETYPQYSFLLDMANPTGIKELKNHIDDKKELDKISSILKVLAESNKIYKGSY